jgi:hypothetical protein
MTRHRLSLLFAGLLLGAQVALAGIIAPRACDGGLVTYAGAGLLALVAIVAVPVLLRPDLTGRRRVLFGAGYALLGVAGWFAGFVLAGLPIACRPA